MEVCGGRFFAGRFILLLLALVIQKTISVIYFCLLPLLLPVSSTFRHGVAVELLVLFFFETAPARCAMILQEPLRRKCLEKGFIRGTISSHRRCQATKTTTNEKSVEFGGCISLFT